MRLAHCIGTLNPAAGGPVFGVRGFVDALMEREHMVSVLTLDAPRAPWLSDWPCPVIACGPARSFYGYAPKLADHLKSAGKRYDAIIVNGLWRYHSRACAALLGRAGVPFFVYPHGMLDTWAKSADPWKHVRKTVYWRVFEHKVISKARCVLFTCSREKVLAQDSFRPYTPQAEAVVNYGIKAETGSPADQVAAFWDAFPQLRRKRILLFVGRIHPKKGCDLLVQAFAAVAAQDPALELLILGPDQGNWGPELLALAGDAAVRNRITLAGPVFGAAKFGALRCAEVLIMPSHSESFGLAVVEALNCGCPVVLSNQVNIAGEVVHGGAGIMGLDTAEGIGSALAKWLDKAPEDREAMRRAAGVVFQNHFNIEHSVSSLLETMGKYGVGTGK